MRPATFLTTLMITAGFLAGCSGEIGSPADLDGTGSGLIPAQWNGKVELCHKRGNGTYGLISVGTAAERAHRAHGDGAVGDLVPDRPGHIFGEDCAPRGSTVFITSTAHDGNLGGLAGADAICSARAVAGGLAGTFVAWLSTSAVDARDRLTEPGGQGFVRTDGAVVATSIADLTDGSIQNPINRDESDVGVPAGYPWTGSDADGTVYTGASTCSNWTSTAGTGMQARSDLTDSRWTGWVLSSCAGDKPLYCFEVDAD